MVADEHSSLRLLKKHWHPVYKHYIAGQLNTLGNYRSVLGATIAS